VTLERFRSGFAIVGCLAALLAAGSAASAAAWEAKVHPRVLAETASGPAEFVIVLEQQADLRGARELKTKTGKGRYAFETLRDLASTTQAPLIQRLESLGADYRSYWIANLIWVHGTREALETMARRADVRRIDANPGIRLATPAEAPTRAALGAGVEWSLTQINADDVWALGYTGDRVVVGGQDTGYQWDHPALRTHYRGWNGFVAQHDHNWHDAIHSGGGSCGPDANLPCDDHNHGTHTMGTMVGDDGGTNQIGVAPGAAWIGCRNMDQGNGTPITYTECFEWFVAPTDTTGQNPDPTLAPHVINNSWICPPSEGCSADTLRTVVENTRAAGIVVVGGAGNSGSDCSTVDAPPAIYEATFAVGATDSADSIAGFSSRGPVTVDGSDRLKPDIAAPGVGIRSSIRDDGYATFNGTSMAGPHVVGVVALLLDARDDLKGRVDEIEAILESTAVPLTTTQDCGGFDGSLVPNTTFGHGRIDALAMLNGDTDADGTSNLVDCLPVDAAVWGAPGPVDDLRLTGGGLTALDWSAPAEPGAVTPRYDVLRSTLADAFTSADCLVDDAPATSASDDTQPATVYYYLVRARTDCGDALGTGSGGGPRSVTVCASR
jgi:subtilisin family serine protease